MELYNKFYAWLQKRWKDEKVYPPTDTFKRKHLSNLSGTVLEIGPGAGSNFRYLPKDVHWIGVEPNSPVNEALRAEAEAQGITNIEIHNDPGEKLPFPNNSCDAVIATFVLCTVKNQAKVLSEMIRVLKPDGKFTFIEHVAAEKGSVLRLYQDLTNPLSRLWAKNCHVNRETLATIKSAGFNDIAVDQEKIRMMGVPIPHIRGTARKPLA